MFLKLYRTKCAQYIWTCISYEWMCIHNHMNVPTCIGRLINLMVVKVEILQLHTHGFFRMESQMTPVRTIWLLIKHVHLKTCVGIARLEKGAFLYKTIQKYVAVNVYCTLWCIMD